MSRLIEYARELEQQGRFEDALNYYEMAIDEKGCPFDIRKDIGQVLNKLGNYQEALDCFDLVLTMDENHFESLFGRAISLIGLNEWVDAFNSLVKAVKLDNDNANCWYYLAIILKEYGEEESARKYFKYFNELDNEDFSNVRSNYEFGLIFKQRENELFRRKRTLNIEGFRKELASYDLDNEKIETLLRTMPYEELLFHMYCLKDLHKDYLTKEIIKQSLGLNDEDIIRMFELEDEEKIKQSVISILGYDPFVDLDDEINVPLYEKTGLFRYIDDHKADNGVIRGISGFNRFVNVMEAKNMPKLCSRNLNYAEGNAQFQINVSNSINVANDNFNQAKKAIVGKNYSDAFVFLDIALENCPADYYNIYNIKFYYATLLSKFKSPDYKLLAFKYCNNIEDKFRYFKNKEVYLLNKACIAYDLSFHYLNFIDEAIYYFNKYLEVKGGNEDIQYLLNSLYLRKL
ncbi:tetratricopeptide repeat protein [Methanobrevibacter millerae]|uniref:Tetratricopeptide repeat-containing protein n=1 Tax=Methanobrevibacter millerae TaxID=230361 RepID=A0A1G5VT46_9EURY|nr:tetratricopeptide repeat protein [Methanobrevibacter millerae]SDA49081.1 Tetratricopeptide repeat-containing protein [Methanobrevibacter millerae]